MYLAEIRIENFRLYGKGAKALVLPFEPGLNVLVGENDSGKSTVVDAIRLCLGTSSQDFLRIEPSDFHRSEDSAPEFRITCKFDDLQVETAGAFAEHLTYYSTGPALYVSLLASFKSDTVGGRGRVNYEVRSGKDASGPIMEWSSRRFLEATYLKPLRDADRELSAGKNSRLSQILQYARELIAEGNEEFDPNDFVDKLGRGEVPTLPKSVANVARLADHLIEKNESVEATRRRLDDDHLQHLQLENDLLSSRISVARSNGKGQELRKVLEKLDLSLSSAMDKDGALPHGLGYSNLLFMACEMLLLAQEDEKLPLLLIEEPEAHLHPQLQMRLVDFLDSRSSGGASRPVQVIVTSHSPSLASRVKLKQLILLTRGKCFALGIKHTRLEEYDYTFLERFLDVTKANLFFARGVFIVEGDAEALLIPTLARLTGCDLSRRGISIVNVGSRGLRRYSYIFLRKNAAEGEIPIRVASLADRDIRPNCAKQLSTPLTGSPRYEEDFASPADRAAHLEKKRGQQSTNVKSFVSDHCTFEYDLAKAGLGDYLFNAIQMAKCERAGNPLSIDLSAWEELKLFKARVAQAPDAQEQVAWTTYSPLLTSLSKAITAQHLAQLLEIAFRDKPEELKALLPPYLREAFDFLKG